MCVCGSPGQAARSAAACTACSAAWQGGTAAPMGMARARPCCTPAPRARRCPSCATSSSMRTRPAPRPACPRTAAARGPRPPPTTTSRWGSVGHTRVVARGNLLRRGEAALLVTAHLWGQANACRLQVSSLGEAVTPTPRVSAPACCRTPMPCRQGLGGMRGYHCRFQPTTLNPKTLQPPCR